MMLLARIPLLSHAFLKVSLSFFQKGDFFTGGENVVRFLT